MKSWFLKKELLDIFNPRSMFPNLSLVKHLPQSLNIITQLDSFFTHAPVISVLAFRFIPLFPALLYFSGVTYSSLHFLQQPWRIRCSYLPSREKLPSTGSLGSWEHTAVVPRDLPQHRSWGPLLLRQPSQGLSMVGTQDPSMGNLCWSKLSQQLSLSQTFDSLESLLPNALICAFSFYRPHFSIGSESFPCYSFSFSLYLS